MLNANNKVNYEPKQKEKKYSLSTVLAWLYLKTIGRMLPEKWNQWAKSILHYNIADNVVQTDDLLNSNREKELKDENERLKEKLKEGSKKKENQSNLNQELTKKEKEITKLKEQVKSLGEEKEIFAKFFAAQAQQIEDLELENEELKSKLAGLKKNYSELVKIAQKRGEEFLAQFKEKSEEILHLQKELIECSKEFANKIEMLSVRVEEKDGQIGSLTQLNERLEQEKKEMENKNNAQQRTISNQDKRIKEQNTLITSLADTNKDIDETVKKENKSLRAQNTDLESKVDQLKKESDTKIRELKSQLEEKQAEFTQAEEKNAEFRKKLESAQQKLEQKITDLTNQLKDSISKLNTAEKNKKDLEGEVKELKEKLQILEKNSAEIEKQKADLEKKLESSQGENKKLQKQVEHLSAKKTENVTTVSIRNSKEIPNQSVTSKPESKQQKLKNELKDASKKPEDINKETKALDAKSMLSTAKSITKSTFSKVQNKLLGNEDLDKFLSEQNEELKKSFPEFKGKHFCHNVLKETIQSLVYQNDNKFKSDKLLELLEKNLVQSGRAIIETKVNKVVQELAKDFVKKHNLKQVIFVKRCAEKLYLNEKDSKAILNSFTGFLANRNDSNNDSVKKFVVQKLTEAEMKCFSDNIQQLASSIRDKFLSPDQRMCNQTQGEVNEYQLTEKAKKEYLPNSSMSHSNTTNVSKGRFK